MDAAQWRRLEALFERALSAAPAERTAYLQAACGDDDALRAELERLLAAHDAAPAFFDELAADLRPAPSTATGRSALDPYGLSGQTLSHYRVLEPLGAGGMGVVYRAEDLRLQRTTALKLLPPEVSRDDDAKRRFIEEARAASALDHVNVCTIYEIDEGPEGSLFIAMAFYEGETLKQKIARGPLPLGEAVDYAKQIARGLARAHARSIVHRDLKPGNVIVTPDGTVKLLDFGLAKLIGRTELTRAGTAMGTAAYMSPEQVRGEAVTHLTDIWSLGVVLYEMLAGERPYHHRYGQAILYAILHEEPEPPSRRRPEVPPALDRVVARCLEKQPERRPPGAEALLDELASTGIDQGDDRTRTGRLPGSGPHASATRTMGYASALSVLALLVAVAVALLVPTSRVAMLGWMGFPALPEDRHVAVLPFNIVGETTDSRIFCDGLVEIFSSQLAALAGSGQDDVFVIPAAEVRRWEVSSAQDARQVFGANLVVNGSFQRVGQRISLTLNLIDTRTLRTLDSRIVNAHPDDLLALQDAALRHLADLLHANVTAPDRALLAAGAPRVSAALDHYVRGRAYLQRIDLEENVDAAIRLFRQAVDEDTLYARAYASLCEAYWRKYDHDRSTRWTDAALASCSNALSLDPRLAEAHVTQAFVLGETGRLDEALHEVRQALALDSTSSDARRTHARVLAQMGRVVEAERAFRSAIALRPDHWTTHNALGVFYMQQGRFREAADAFRQITILTPDNVWGHLNLGSAYFFLDRLPDARRVWERAIQIRPNYSAYSNLGTVYFAEGRYPDAARAYEQALELDDRDYQVWGNLAAAYYWMPGGRALAVDAFRRAAVMAEEALTVSPEDPTLLVHLAGYEALLEERSDALAHVEQALQRAGTSVEVVFRAAAVYEQLGARAQALTWLERALEADYPLSSVEQDPWLAALRGDPRYHRLMERIRGSP